MGSEIVLNKSTYPLYVGGSCSENFMDWDGKGSSVLLEAQVLSKVYTQSDIEWRIEDTSIADFDCSGQKEHDAKFAIKIRARRTGVTSVIAQLPNDSYAKCYLTVIDNYTRLTVSKIELNTNELHLQEGKNAYLIPILYPKDIYQKGMLDTSLVWASSNEKVAIINNGKVIAVKSGDANITVRSADVNRSAVCHVKVSETNVGGNNQKIDVAETIEMLVGDFRDIFYGADDLPHHARRMVWRSENKFIADVDENGRIIACSVSIGQKVDETGMSVQEIPEVVWVYATDIDGGNIVKYPVIVKPVSFPVCQISLCMSELSIPMNESKNITAAVNLPGLSNVSVIWRSSSEEILTVTPTEDTIYGAAQAIVTANAAGNAVVTVSSGNRNAYCKVVTTSDAVKVESICIESQKEIDIDQVFQFQPIITKNATNKKLHWIIKDSETATLDREGNIQGYRSGETRIYAIADDSLSSAKKKCIENFCDDRIKQDNSELEQLLMGTVYAECVLRVRNDNKVLRNLHIVEESITDNSILLLWNRASLLDTDKFDHYIVFCNGNPIAETQKLGYRAETLNPGTAYQFQVAAVDNNGNILSQAAVTAITRRKSIIINVLDYGVAGNGSRTDTFFIQKAIDDCPKNGTVWLPENHIYISGALFLKSDMTFQVDGILLGSSDPKDYPRVVSKWEGWRKLEQSAQDWENSSNIISSLHTPVTVNHRPHASLLNAGVYDEGENGISGPYNVRNLVICGKGQINANGFSLAYNEGPNANTAKITSRAYPVKDATLRGSAIRIHNGFSIYLKDVQVAYAPGWTIHTIYCKHITFDGMDVVSHGDGDCGQGTSLLHCGHIFNGDGIDPESCTHVNVFNVSFTTGDDAIAIKSGRNKEGNELNKPNAYIRITDCVSRWSIGGFGTGSETAGGSHDLLFQNLLIENVFLSGIWLKTCAPRGGITENVQVRDVTADACNSPVWVLNNYSGSRLQVNPSINLPIVRNLTFENVHGKANNEKGFRFTGSPECTIQNVRLRGVSSGGKESEISFCEDLSLIL